MSFGEMNDCFGCFSQAKRGVATAGSPGHLRFSGDLVNPGGPTNAQQWFLPAFSLMNIGRKPGSGDSWTGPSTGFRKMRAASAFAGPASFTAGGPNLSRPTICW